MKSKQIQAEIQAFRYRLRGHIGIIVGIISYPRGKVSMHFDGQLEERCH